MPIRTDSIQSHAAGILRTVPSSQQIDDFEAAYDTLGKLDAALLEMAATKVDPLVGLYQAVSPPSTTTSSIAPLTLPVGVPDGSEAAYAAAHILLA